VDQHIELLQRIETELKTANELARQSLELQKKAGDMQATLTAEMSAHIARATEINAGAKSLQQKSIAISERAQKIQRVLPVFFAILFVALGYALYKLATFTR
jgi:hypothetical protein